MLTGKTSDDLCPVTALLSYLALRGVEPDHCFVGSQEPHCQNSEHVWDGLKKAQLPASDYAGHSFHIGSATTAAVMRLELEDSAIQTLGRWESSSYKIYIRQDLSPALAQCQIYVAFETERQTFLDTTPTCVTINTYTV